MSTCYTILVAQLDQETLRSLARRYLWWRSPAEAASTPRRVFAQVMDIGDYEDVQRLAHAVGDDVLRDVLTHAEAGQFRPRSWAYWHYRLGLCRPQDPVPPPPARHIPH